MAERWQLEETMTTPEAVGELVEQEALSSLRSLRDHFSRLSRMPSSAQPHYPAGMRPFGNGDVRQNIDALDWALGTLEAALERPHSKEQGK